MRAIEAAALEAGLPYPRGDEGRRRAKWRSVTGDGPHGFELPLSDPNLWSSSRSGDCVTGTSDEGAAAVLRSLLG
jgi:hypothetical protein